MTRSKQRSLSDGLPRQIWHKLISIPRGSARSAGKDGYWKDLKTTEQALTEDGLRLLTGDVAQMDSDGYFRIIARKADMWYASRDKPGKPAFPRGIEEVIYEILQVCETAVVASRPFAFILAGRERPTPKL